MDGQELRSNVLGLFILAPLVLPLPKSKRLADLSLDAKWGRCGAFGLNVCFIFALLDRLTSLLVGSDPSQQFRKVAYGAIAIIGMIASRPILESRYAQRLCDQASQTDSRTRAIFLVGHYAVVVASLLGVVAIR